MTFKNRGHFCNYCRKIVANKAQDIPMNGGAWISINESIWKVWDSQDKVLIAKFLFDLSELKITALKEFNNQLRSINKKYK